jgi:hypothetical protein
MRMLTGDLTGLVMSGASMLIVGAPGRVGAGAACSCGAAFSRRCCCLVTNGHALARRIAKHEDAIAPTIRLRLYIKKPSFASTQHETVRP